MGTLPGDGGNHYGDGGIMGMLPGDGGIMGTEVVMRGTMGTEEPGTMGTEEPWEYMSAVIMHKVRIHA